MSEHPIDQERSEWIKTQQELRVLRKGLDDLFVNRAEDIIRGEEEKQLLYFTTEEREQVVLMRTQNPVEAYRSTGDARFTGEIFVYTRNDEYERYEIAQETGEPTMYRLIEERDAAGSGRPEVIDQEKMGTGEINQLYERLVKRARRPLGAEVSDITEEPKPPGETLTVDQARERHFREQVTGSLLKHPEHVEADDEMGEVSLALLGRDGKMWVDIHRLMPVGRKTGPEVISVINVYDNQPVTYGIMSDGSIRCLPLDIRKYDLDAEALRQLTAEADSTESRQRAIQGRIRAQITDARNAMEEGTAGLQEVDSLKLRNLSRQLAGATPIKALRDRLS